MNTPATPTYSLWEHIDNVLTWVDEANGRSELETARRLLKVVEEIGEVASAYIGMVGQNPRKGITHDRDDLLAELYDSVVTGLIAAATIADDVPAARAALDRHLARRGHRLSLLTEGATA
jgi:hypothetical protein